MLARQADEKKLAADEAAAEREAIVAVDELSDATINMLLRLAVEDGRTINDEYISNDQIYDAFRAIGESETEQGAPGAGETVAGEAGGSGAEGGAEARPGLSLQRQTPQEIRQQEADRRAEEAEARRQVAQEENERRQKEKRALEDAVKSRAANPDNFQFGESGASAAKPMGKARAELVAAIKRVVDTMMVSEKSQTTDADVARDRARKRVDDAVKSLDYYAGDLRSTLKEGPYNKNKKVATEAQLQQWDAMVERLKTGDMGEQVYIDNPSKMRGALGFATGAVLRDMNALYKAVTGRSFLRQDPQSTGRRMHWAVQAIKENLERTHVEQDETHTYKGRTDFYLEAKEIDSYRTGDYWSMPEELGARAFESYIFDKLTGTGGRSDYLVYAVENRYYAGLGMKPYPEGAERQAINTAFDKLFAEIKTKETGNGVAFFSASPSALQQGSTVASARDAIARQYGALTARQLESGGLLTLAQTQDEAIGQAAKAWGERLGGSLEAARQSIFGSMRAQSLSTGKIRGFYVPQLGKSWIVAGNVAASEVPAVLAHEIGIHAAKGLSGVFKRAGELLAKGKGAFFDKVRDRMAKAGETSGEEAAAYIVEEVEKARATAPLSAHLWVRDFIAKVRAWLHGKGILIKTETLTPADLAAIARANVRAARNAADGSRQTWLGSLGNPVFYSPLSRAIAKAKFASAPAAQWKLWLAGNAANLGVKKDEIQWSGIHEFLDLKGKGKITREEIGAFLDQNGVKVEEVMKGANKWRVINSYGQESELFDTEEEAQHESEKWIEQAESVLPEGEELDNPDEFGEVIQVKEGDTTYAQYTLPGGEDYRELLLTLPVKTKPVYAFDEWKRMVLDDAEQRDASFAALGVSDPVSPDLSKEAYNRYVAAFNGVHTDYSKTYQSPHWDEPNVLAHIRFNSRSDADGAKVLFIDEIQSDWAQKGKKEGFIGDPIMSQGKPVESGEVITQNAPPKAPFVTDTKAWVALAIKRMMRYAADNGFEKIAFVTGEQSAERYDLSKQVDEISYEPTDKGFYINVMAGGRNVQNGDYAPGELEDIVGKEIVQKMQAGEGKIASLGDPDLAGVKNLSGLDLKVGGEGMKAFYDRIVPQVANDLLKKLGGGKVGVVEIDTRVPESDAWYEALTDENILKQPGFTVPASAAEPMPLFSRTLAELYNDELSNRPAPHRVIYGAELKALRRAAAGIERPKDGIFLAVTADGYAVATGQKGQRIPDSFRRFAKENDLILRAERRTPAGIVSPANQSYITPKSAPMPIAYRESGAMYFGEGKGEPLDRTGRTRFSVGSDDTGGTEARRQFAETERAYGGRETYERTRSAGRTKLNYRQWVLARTPAFKAWFGDWELAALRGFLDGEPVAVLEGNQAPLDRGFAGLRAWAADIFRRQGGVAASPEIGDVLLDERAVRDSQGHGRMNRTKAEAFAAVKDVIERGRVVRRVPASDALDSIYISAPVKIGDVDDVVTVLVHRDVNTQRMYLHSVTTKESLRDGRVSGADAQASQRSGSSQGGGDLTVLHDALNFNGEVSKAVDPETGEPMVMYHGTHRDIGSFNTPIAWATSDPRHASGYAESGAELRDNGAGAAVVMPAYVSVQRPFNAPGGYLNIGELIDEAVKQAADHGRPVSAADAAHYRTSMQQAWDRFGLDDSRVDVHHHWSMIGRPGTFMLRDMLQQMGFDGIQYTESGYAKGGGYVADTFGAFSTAGVKSATGNTGAFDGRDPDIRHSFAGRNAQGANLHALDGAKQRIAMGEDPEAVRRDTGWHRGVDGKWRFEISDRQASIAVPGDTAGEIIGGTDGRQAPTVGDVLRHPRLFAAYPHLADIPIAIMAEGERAQARLVNRGGALKVEVNSGMPRVGVASAVLHELQHAIQIAEGFAMGGSAKRFSSDIATTGAVTYKRLAGEVEARNTQTRQAMTDAQRQEIAPEDTADVRPGDVLVTFNGRDLPDAAAPQNLTGRAPLTERSLVRAFEREFPWLGQALRTMLQRGQAGKRGGVVMVDSADPLRIASAFAQKTGKPLSEAIQLFEEGGRINGFYDAHSGLTFLIGPNLDAVTGPAVLLHEVTHGQQRQKIDARAMDLLMNRAQVKDAGLRAFLDRVASRMVEAGEAANEREAVGYIVEQAVSEGRSQGFSVADHRFLAWVDQTIGQRVGDLLRSFLAMVRGFMLRHGMGVGEIPVDDLVGYAMAGLGRAAAGEVRGRNANVSASIGTAPGTQGVDEQYRETERAYGGRDGYERAKAEGKTKLSYRQWVQVRTPAFKAWFGDWENGQIREDGQDQGMADGAAGRPVQTTSTASAEVAIRGQNVRGNRRIPSVTLDPETGEPRVFFHGTNDDIAAFDLTHPNRKDAGWLGRGVYVTSDEYLAESYTNLKRSGSAGPNLIPVFVRSTSDIYMADLKFKQKMSRVSQATVDDVTQQMRDAGFDGAAIVFGDGTIELGTFSPGNVKSAIGNNGNFDQDNDDIRFSRSGTEGAQALAVSPSGDGGRGLKQNLPHLLQSLYKVSRPPATEGVD